MKKITVYSHECNGTYDMEQYLNSNQRFAITGVYLHGDLQDIVGYDIVYVPINKSIDDITDAKERRTSNYNAILGQLFTGIHNVLVKADGNQYEAKAYVYLDTNHRPEEGGKLRGLIVLPEDTESVEYAIKCYEKQKQYL